MKTIDERTIQDFGDQWYQFSDNEGFYGSIESLEDKCGNLMSVEDVRGKDVCEIGAGAGRFIGILSQLSPKSILAITPSFFYKPHMASLLGQDYTKRRV